VHQAATAEAGELIEKERGRWTAHEWLELIAGAVELAGPVLPAARGALGKVVKNAGKLKGLFKQNRELADGGTAKLDDKGAVTE
jgi:hypothetical protein